MCYIFVCFVLSYADINIFYLPEVVGRGSETQLQVG